MVVKGIEYYRKNKLTTIVCWACCQSSVNLSAPAILLPQVRVPCTLSMLLSFIVFVRNLSCEKNENLQKEAEFGPLIFFKTCQCTA